MDKSIRESDEIIKKSKLTPKFDSKEAEVAYENISIIKNAEMSESVKESLISSIAEKNNDRIIKNKKMKAFAKLALSGDNVPSETDIRNATKFLGYKEKEKETIEGGRS